MNSEEYTQLIKASFKASKYIKDTEKLFAFIDEIRDEHEKLQKKLEKCYVDPVTYEQQETREKIRDIALEIKSLSNISGIGSKFFKLPDTWIAFTKEFYNGVFVVYSFDGIDVTDLIVFNKKKFDKKKVDISDLSFSEDGKVDVPETFIHTEQNDLPNTPLALDWKKAPKGANVPDYAQVNRNLFNEAA